MRRSLLIVVLAACVGDIKPPAASIGGTLPGDPGGTGAGGPSDPPPEVIPPFEPATLQGRLLVSWQYVNAIRDVLGDAAARAVTPPQDVSINGLAAIGAGTVSLSTVAVQQYETNAYAAAHVAVLSYGCTAAQKIDDACFGKFLDVYGKRIFRRPMTPEERTTWTAVQHDAATAYGDFQHGVEFALAGLLQSPAFLYRFEIGTPENAWVKLTPYELATRLSFFIAGTTPPDALLAAAETGGLDTPDSVRAQAVALLSLPGTGPAIASFFDEVMDQGGLDNLDKDSTTYPTFDVTLSASMREELHRFIQDAAFAQDFRALLDADYTFVDAKLAGLYGLPPPASGWARVQLLPTQPRAGLLGEASYLALKAHPVNTSPTLRGKLIREKFLCEPVAAPPPDVNTNLPEPVPGQTLTLREKLSGHLAEPSCAACHKLMDPLGFAFENFDAIGAYRTLDNGKPVDTTGALDGKAFTNAKDLVGLLKADPRVVRCLTKTVYRQGAGHVELAGETAPLRAAEKAFADSGYQLRFLLVELATSDAFRYGRAAP